MRKCFVLLVVSGLWALHGICTAVSVRDLSETGPLQRRWMTMPGSRIVVNPYDFNSRSTPLQQSAGPDLPLHLVYYAGGECAYLRNALLLHQQISDQAGEIRIGWKAPIGNTTNWASDQKMELRSTPVGELQVTATGRNGLCINCGATTQSVEIDLDTYPFLEINVKEAVGHWALKVGDEATTQDISLQSDTRAAGIFSYDVRKATGWSGRKRLDVKLFAINIGYPVTVSGLRFAGVSSPARVPAEEFNTTWYPHLLKASANFARQGRVAMADAFVDESSVQRKYVFSGMGPGKKLSLSGQYNGTLSWDAERKSLIIENSTFTVAMAFTGVQFALGPSHYKSVLEHLVNLQTTQPLSNTSAIWSLHLPVNVHEVTVGIAFSTIAEGKEAARERASKAADFPRAGLVQHAYWDEFLASVPRPRKFELNHVDPLGISARDLESAYYKAWVFTAANLLPVMPETGFNYPQLAAGKPCMWGDGHPRARATASWESLFAMQLYGHTNPDAAWDAFLGLMSLVDEKGRLGGESLPSRKAQTALILYRLTKDADKLRTIYPALKRYLFWRRDNPRWIHKEHDYADQKDSDFVVSAIMDMAQAREIAKILELSEDADLWDRERKALFAKYLEWFWATPTSDPAEIYFTGNKARSAGIPLWVAAGIHLDLLKGGPQLDGLYRVYKAEMKRDKPFLGFGIPKYPEIGFLVYGLIERGRLNEAAELANASVRDVTRSNMFAEQYFVDNFPHPDGVRPSMFGAAMLIDMIWVKNGVRFDTGVPVEVKLPGESGSVDFKKTSN